MNWKTWEYIAAALAMLAASRFFVHIVRLARAWRGPLTLEELDKLTDRFFTAAPLKIQDAQQLTELAHATDWPPATRDFSIANALIKNILIDNSDRDGSGRLASPALLFRSLPRHTPNYRMHRSLRFTLYSALGGGLLCAYWKGEFLGSLLTLTGLVFALDLLFWSTQRHAVRHLNRVTTLILRFHEEASPFLSQPLHRALGPFVQVARDVDQLELKNGMRKKGRALLTLLAALRAIAREYRRDIQERIRAREERSNRPLL